MGPSRTNRWGRGAFSARASATGKHLRLGDLRGPRGFPEGLGHRSGGGGGGGGGSGSRQAGGRGASSSSSKLWGWAPGVHPGVGNVGCTTCRAPWVGATPKIITRWFVWVHTANLRHPLAVSVKQREIRIHPPTTGRHGIKVGGGRCIPEGPWTPAPCSQSGRREGGPARAEG